MPSGAVETQVSPLLLDKLRDSTQYSLHVPELKCVLMINTAASLKTGSYWEVGSSPRNKSHAQNYRRLYRHRKAPCKPKTKALILKTKTKQKKFEALLGDGLKAALNALAGLMRAACHVFQIPALGS